MLKILFFSCLNICLISSLFALTQINSDSLIDSYVVNTVKWVPITYENEQAKISAYFPGKEDKMERGNSYIYSTYYKNTIYSLHAYPITHKNQVSNYIQAFSSIGYAELSICPSEQSLVKDVIQIDIYKDNFRKKKNLKKDQRIATIRLYETSDVLYIASVVGKNLSEAKNFFQTVYIER